MAKEIYKVKLALQNKNTLITFLTLLGLAVRLNAPLSVIFPLNDGGLFYKMILELQENHFALPMFTNYNFDQIPYAYPPFSFYLYGIIAEFSGISLLDLSQFLPAIISALAIPAFYLLASEILEDTKIALLGTMTFVLIPRAFDWLIMGGGITRSLGFLFAILAIRQIYLFFTKPTAQQLATTTLLCSLVTLTHPEATIHTIIAAVFIYIWKDRTRTGVIRSAIIALGVVTLTSPWWITVLSRHNIVPFQAAMNASGVNNISLFIRILTLFKFQFTDEPFMQLISVVGLLGLFILLARQKFDLPCWLALISLIEPRGGTLYMTLPLCMSAGVALHQLHLLIQKQDENPPSWVWNTFIGFFLLYGLINASSTTSHIADNLTLTSDDLNAMAWVRENVPAEASFAVITQANPLNDSTSEWFPVLAGRKSVATVFGYEWSPDRPFMQYVQAYNELQKCAQSGVICLDTWKVSHIYIQEPHRSILSEQLDNSLKYRKIYARAGIAIFEKLP